MELEIKVLIFLLGLAVALFLWATPGIVNKKYRNWRYKRGWRKNKDGWPS